MIIVNLKGGTGNQMFQYALGRRLALQNNTELVLDTNGLDRANKVGDIYRPFALSAFTISGRIATPAEVARLKYPYGPLSKLWRFITFKFSKDKNTLFHPHVLSWTGNRYLDGYWQSPRYFETIRDTLLADFTLKEPLTGNARMYMARINQSNAVSLHVRRGDYAKNPQVARDFGSCSRAYYERAITYIRTHVEHPTFFVFSDDIPWVKENLPLGDDAVYVEGNDLTDTMELSLMRFCAHNIIANSSFSWWGAWLNANPHAIIIAPTPWFNRTPYDTDLIPPSWIQLPK